MTVPMWFFLDMKTILAVLREGNNERATFLLQCVIDQTVVEEND
jgi:hypothetical protein